MWYTARDKATGRMCLGVATASTPSGPFVDSNTKPTYCPPSDQGNIDASPFIDDDGTAYLTYKSDVPAGLRISRLADDGRTIVAGTEHVLLSQGAESEGRIVEGPTMNRVNGQLYLFYSMDFWWTADYRVGVLRCDSVTGPCAPIYSTAVLATRGSMAGPGGQTPFQNRSGDWYMMFHAWTSPAINYPNGARSLRLLPLTFTDGNPKIG
jgi:beta-xylosidase